MPYAAAVLVVFIWSGWITISRHGVQTTLQPADITLLRYTTAGLVILPLILRHRWQKYSLYQYLVIGLGVGFPYTLFSFYGLQAVKAAQAGVLVNGMLPVMGAVVALFVFSQKISLQRWLAVLLILVANLTMAGRELLAMDHLLGLFLLLGAASVYTLHMTGVKLWGFTWQDTIVTVAVVNVVLFFPLWFMLPTHLVHSPIPEILTQAVYQGVVVNVLALMCVAYALRHLGTMTVSLFMSFVPVVTAFFAWVFLQEALVFREIVGISGCSIGLLLYAFNR